MERKDRIVIDTGVLISADKDLLDMQPLTFQLKILSPRKFIELRLR